MDTIFKDLIKPVLKTHQDTLKEGVTQHWCSTFIKNKNVLIKGEFDNQHKDKRNAIIVLFDCESGNLIGQGSET